jgi:hypothetical protein
MSRCRCCLALLLAIVVLTGGVEAFCGRNLQVLGCLRYDALYCSKPNTCFNSIFDSLFTSSSEGSYCTGCSLGQDVNNNECVYWIEDKEEYSCSCQMVRAASYKADAVGRTLVFELRIADTRFSCDLEGSQTVNGVLQYLSGYTLKIYGHCVQHSKFVNADTVVGIGCTATGTYSTDIVDGDVFTQKVDIENDEPLNRFAFLDDSRLT